MLLVVRLLCVVAAGSRLAPAALAEAGPRLAPTTFLPSTLIALADTRPAFASMARRVSLWFAKVPAQAVWDEKLPGLELLGTTMVFSVPLVQVICVAMMVLPCSHSVCTLAVQHCRPAL